MHYTTFKPSLVSPKLIDQSLGFPGKSLDPLFSRVAFFNLIADGVPQHSDPEPDFPGSSSEPDSLHRSGGHPQVLGQGLPDPDHQLDVQRPQRV